MWPAGTSGKRTGNSAWSRAFTRIGIFAQSGGGIPVCAEGGCTVELGLTVEPRGIPPIHTGTALASTFPLLPYRTVNRDARPARTVCLPVMTTHVAGAPPSSILKHD